MTYTQRISITIFSMILLLGVVFTFVMEKQITNAIELEHQYWSKSIAQAITKAVVSDTITGHKRKVTEALKRIIKESETIQYIVVVDFNGEYFTSASKPGIEISRDILDHTHFVGYDTNQKNDLVKIIYDLEYLMINNLDGHLHMGVDTSRTYSRVEELRVYMIANS